MLIKEEKKKKDKKTSDAKAITHHLAPGDFLTHHVIHKRKNYKSGIPSCRFTDVFFLCIAPEFIEYLFHLGRVGGKKNRGFIVFMKLSVPC